MSSDMKVTSIRVGPEMQNAITQIRDIMGFTSDAEVYRAAIGTQLRVARAIAADEKVLVSDQKGENIRELVFMYPGPLPK